MKGNKVLTKTHGVLNPHSKSLTELSDILRTDLKIGLKVKEAEERLTLYGRNYIPPVKASFWEVWISPLLNWLVNIYLIISTIMIILAFWVPSAWGQVSFWLSIIAFNVIFIVIQQIRAQFKLDALHKLTAPTTTVIRNGMIFEISAELVVPGDLIMLDQGDRVPADARLIEAYNLLVNESALTGESQPVEKNVVEDYTLPEDTAISQRSNMVYLGTYIERGKAVALVVNTGIHTELGSLSTELQEVGRNDIPIRDKVNQLAKWLGVVVVGFLISSVTYKLIMHSIEGTINEPEIILPDIVISVTTSMAIMPISIPLLTTVILLTGVLEMSKHRIIIKNLAAIETLGRCSILCTDKTGTITKNQMTIQRIWDTENLYAVSGIGYSNKGAIYPYDLKFDTEDKKGYEPPTAVYPYHKESSLYFLLIGGMLNNDAKLIVEEVFEPEEQISWKTTGDPTDGAFLALFNKSGLNENVIRSKFMLVNDLTFDPNLKRMSKVFKNLEDNKFYIFCKGATEPLLELCTEIGPPNNKRPFSEHEKKEVLELTNFYASKGYRVISLAYRIVEDEEIIHKKRHVIEQSLCYNGFVCMLDPPRYGTERAVKECKSAGITPIMITGDSLLTGVAIAKKIGLMTDSDIGVEGYKIKELTEEEFAHAKVFARVSPQHKQEIVERYKKNGKVIAMCGDGVNDALALTVADVGIGMGIAGTDVAKQASDVIIADDSFVSIVRGIREGRGLFEKIRVMIFFYIAINIGEAIIYFSSSYVRNFSLLNDYQRAIVFTTAHVLPPLALVFDSITKEIMDFPPRDDEAIFNKRYIGAMAVLAISLAISAATIYFIAYKGYLPVTEFNKSGIVPKIGENGENRLNPKSWEHAKARTMFLAFLLITESFLTLSMRRFNKSLLKSLKEDRKFIVFLLISIVPVGTIILDYATPIQELLRKINFNLEFIPLSFADWLIILSFTVLTIAMMELYKYIIRKKGEYF